MCYHHILLNNSLCVSLVCLFLIPFRLDFCNERWVPKMIGVFVFALSILMIMNDE